MRANDSRELDMSKLATSWPCMEWYSIVHSIWLRLGARSASSWERGEVVRPRLCRVTIGVNTGARDYVTPPTVKLEGGN